MTLLKRLQWCWPMYSRPRSIYNLTIGLRRLTDFSSYSLKLSQLCSQVYLTSLEMLSSSTSRWVRITLFTQRIHSRYLRTSINTGRRVTKSGYLKDSTSVATGCWKARLEYSLKAALDRATRVKLNSNGMEWLVETHKSTSPLTKSPIKS
jgi:hypothetical protein